MFPIDQPSKSPAFHGFSQRPQAAMPGRLQASSDAQADDWRLYFSPTLLMYVSIYDGSPAPFIREDIADIVLGS